MRCYVRNTTCFFRTFFCLILPLIGLQYADAKKCVHNVVKPNVNIFQRLSENWDISETFLLMKVSKCINRNYSANSALMAVWCGPLSDVFIGTTRPIPPKGRCGVAHYPMCSVGTTRPTPPKGRCGVAHYPMCSDRKFVCQHPECRKRRKKIQALTTN